MLIVMTPIGLKSLLAHSWHLQGPPGHVTAVTFRVSTTHVTSFTTVESPDAA